MSTIKELKKDNGNVYVTITHEPNNNLIFVDWDGFLPVELVKEGSEELLEMIKEIGCPNVLVNNQKISGPWQDANSWYQSDWNPRAANAGLKNMAVIMSENIFTQMSLQGFTEVTEGVYTVGVFKSNDEARNWISTVEPVA